MKKFFKRKEQVEIAHNEQDLFTLLQEIKQQLVFLEKKVDAISSPPQERPRERSFNRDRGPKGGGFRERSFTKAVCAQCNKVCEVPFKPEGDRPVYCKDCFSKRQGTSFEGRRDSRTRSGGFDQERHSGRYFDKRQGGESRQFGPRKRRGKERV